MGRVDPHSEGFETQDFPTHFLFPGTTSKRIFHSRLSLFPFLSLSLSLSLCFSTEFCKGEEAMHIFLESKSRERGEAVKAE